MKKKSILAAGIVRDVKFCNKYAAESYLKVLPSKVFDYEVLDRYDLSDGTVIVRILTPYNNSCLIEL